MPTPTAIAGARAPAPQPIVLTEALVRTHQAAVWRHLRLCGAAPELADDLTQEAFLRLCQRPPEDRGERALGAWLRTTARNLLRNSHRRPALLPLDDDAAEAAHTHYQRDDRGEGYRTALAKCLAALSAREREALELRYGPNGSRAAVTAALGIADEGVKTLLRRLRVRLLACVHHRLENP